MIDRQSVPSGTVTFLFTDIEGSTQLWEEHPDQMPAALEAHDAVLREVIESRGGYVFTTAGDSFAAAFSVASDAVAAAVAGQQALQAWPWDEIELRVRMGVHTGDATERDGDYFGPVVNRSARLMSTAHGRQIVLSATTAELTDTAQLGVDVRDLGNHVLKDLADPIHVWQVLGTDLVSEFPPLRSVNAFEHNLPVRLERLIGREAEAAQLNELVGAHRLVTVVGPGGMGKTRLAIQVAAEFLDEYADGVWFVDLTSASADIDSVAAAVGRALGFDARQGDSWRETVEAALSVRNVLLVLDNCEHVVDAVAVLVRSVLDAAPRGQILTTSRERLDLAGEHVWPLGALLAGPELFAERATAIDPTFDPGECVEAVDTICARLDGLPLAIELAAARVGSLQPAEIASRLDQRFRLLRSRDRTADERHRTLEATIDWSYEQLDADAADLFRRLSVIAGTFDLEAATGVAASDLDEYDVADLVDDLVAKSLVATTSLGDTTRYRLLETVAAYARARLEADDDLDSVRRQHARMRTDLTVKRCAALIDGSGQPGLLRTLLADLDDIDEVFSWACDREPALAERIIAPTYFFLPTRTLGAPRMLDWSSSIAELYRRGDCSPLNAGLAGNLMASTGGMEEADKLAASLLADPTLDAEARFVALNVAAHCAYMLHNDTGSAIGLIEQSLGHLEVIDNPSPATWAVIVNFAQAGAFDRAVQVLDRYLDSSIDAGYLGILQRYAAGAALRVSDLARSTASLRTCLGLCERYRDPGASWFRYQLALNELAARNTEDAAHQLAQVLPQLLDLGDPQVVTLALEDFATSLARTSRLAGAATMFAVAESERSRLNFEAFDAYVRRRDRIIPRLRDQLGQHAFEAAWEEGHTLTIDEAVRYASTLVAP